LSNGTKLAWLIDIQKKQIWVWVNQELPLIYADHYILPSLDNILELTVGNVMAMTQQR
jgi:hypothetical protein